MLADTNEALADVRVRRALNLAVNTDEYNEIGQAGFATSTTGQLLPPGFAGYNDELSGYGYDPDEARNLLQEAGYPNLELSMLASNTIRVQAEIIAGYLQAIGINVTLETPDSNTVIGEVQAGTEYNLLMWDSSYVTLGDWSQAAIPFTVSANVQRHFDNDRFFELNEQVSVAATQEERTALVEEIATLMNEEVATVFLSWKEFFYIHTPRIASLPINLDTSPRIYDIEMLVE